MSRQYQIPKFSPCHALHPHLLPQYSALFSEVSFLYCPIYECFPWFINFIIIGQHLKIIIIHLLLSHF